MKTITHAMRMELANAVRDRYLAATNKHKRQILDEFIAVTGYHEKSAIRVLNARSAPRSWATRVTLFRALMASQSGHTIWLARIP